MEWYWTLLIVLGYIALWIVTSMLFARDKTFDVSDGVFIGLFWPVSLTYGIVYRLVCYLMKKCEKRV